MMVPVLASNAGSEKYYKVQYVLEFSIALLWALRVTAFSALADLNSKMEYAENHQEDVQK